MARINKIQIRRDTSANWTLANPILAEGELGYETDTAKLKIGEGATSWSSLGYFSGSLTLTNDVTGTGTSTIAVTIANNAVNDAKIAAHTSSKITISNKGQLNSAIVYNDQANTFGAFDQTFKDSNLKIVASADATKVLTFSNASQTTGTTTTISNLNTASRTLQIPALTGTDTLATLGLAQTFTVAKTFNDAILTIRNPANTFSYSIRSSAITANRDLALPLISQTETLAVQPQVLQAAPANPTGTTSTTGVMAGLSQTITPRVTGRLLILISGVLHNSIGDNGVSARIRQGTGATPTNGAALTGTAFGNLATSNLIVSAGASVPNIVPFTCQSIITGLTLGTTVWIDLQQAAITGGSASLTNLSVSVIEI